MDCLRALREKYGEEIHLLSCASTRDVGLAKVQNDFQNGIMDVDEAAADVYQQTLRDTVNGDLRNCGLDLVNKEY